MFQYQVWKKSLDAQYLVEAAVVLMFAFAFLTVAHLLVDWEYDIEVNNALIDTLSSQTQTSSITSQLSETKAKLEELSSDYLNYLDTLIIFGILSYTYFLKDIQELIYANIRNVHITTFTFQMLINIACFIIVTFWVIMHFAEFKNNLSGLSDSEKATKLIERMEASKIFGLNYILAILVSIQFMRLVSTLQVSRTFGPMVKTLGSMLVDGAIFLLLYVFIFIIFASAGQLLFNELSEFENIVESSKTLFGASLGNFEYVWFDNMSEVSPYTGYIFLTIFLLFTMILLLNFLIAILSNTYANLNDLKNALYLRKVLFLRQRYDYHRLYSAILFGIPPLNVFSLFCTPFIIHYKSRKFNRIILICQYILIGVVSIVLFAIGSLLIQPIAYLLLIFQKLRHVPIRPFITKYDIFLRILDVFAFIFAGPFLLLFWFFIDILNYTLMLFAYNIIYINDYEEEKQEQINKEMDGSLAKSSEADSNGNISLPVTQFGSRSLANMKLSNKGVNPIKEGLADSTLKILKACLKKIKDKHLEEVGDIHNNDSNFYFVPTVCVLDEMRSFLMVHEQINSILLGLTYKKSTEFLKSSEFDELVEWLAEYEEKDLIIEDTPREEESSEFIQNDIDQVFESGIRLKSRNTENKKDFWKQKLCNFLTRSNEKWILDQFNLCKKFLNQNSIEGHYDDFSHPAYEKFKHIRSMKAKCTDGDNILKMKKRFSVLVSEGSIANETPRFPNQKPSTANMQGIDLTVLKCDICALLRTIEEIENP